MILCCDTSTSQAVFAVADRAGNLVSSLVKFHYRDLSVQLFNDIDAVLAKADIGFDSIDVLAVGLGPGSFTGVRIAVTTLRTLAQSSGKKLVGVGTLPLIAHGVDKTASASLTVVAILPSRRGEIYAGVYRGGEQIKPPFAATFAEIGAVVAEMAEAGEVVTCGSDGVLPIPIDNIAHVAVEHPSTTGFAELAAAEAQQSRWADPMSLNPLYVVAPAINQHKDPRTLARLFPQLLQAP